MCRSSLRRKWRLLIPSAPAIPLRQRSSPPFCVANPWPRPIAWLSRRRRLSAPARARCLFSPPPSPSDLGMPSPLFHLPLIINPAFSPRLIPPGQSLDNPLVADFARASLIASICASARDNSFFSWLQREQDDGVELSFREENLTRSGEKRNRGGSLDGGPPRLWGYGVSRAD